MDAVTLALAKKHTNEQVIQKATNSPTKTISFDCGAYSLPSTVVNGQFSDISIRGLTATNLVKNGNFAGTNEWFATASSIITSNNTLSVTGDGTALIPRIYTYLKDLGVGTKKIFIKLKVRVTNAECLKIEVYYSGAVSSNIVSIDNPVQNQWYTVYAVTNTEFTIASPQVYIRHSYIDNTTANGKVMEVQEVFALNMTVEGLESLTKEEMNAKFPNWFDGTKSTNSVRIRSVNEDETKESIAYVNLPQGEELRSLPNGVNDEVNVSEGKVTQNVSDEIALGTGNIELFATGDTDNYYGCCVSGLNPLMGVDTFKVFNYNETLVTASNSIFNSADYRIIRAHDTNGVLYFKAPKSEVNILSGSTLKTKINTWFVNNSITLTYQLATPIVTDIPKQKLEVFENGTVYVEPVGDASESTLPSVEMTIPTGTSNKFGVASHNYDGAAADWVLTNSESKCFLLAVSSAGGAANIIAPNRPGTMYAISNASGYTITIKISGGNGVDVNTGKKVLVIHDGTDYTALAEL